MRTVILLFLLVMLCAFQQGGEIPPDDPNPEWPGQKAWCNNFKSTHPEHRCNCARAAHRDCTQPPPNDTDLSGNDGMSAKCKTYCRKEHCSCQNNCTS